MTDHKNCQALLGSLSDYVDGILREELCAEIETHMRTCDNCRIVVDTLRKTINLYQITSKPPALPEEVRERLYRRLYLDDFLDK
jgi:predicted anti-sigma-YlaC factor YlaD